MSNRFIALSGAVLLAITASFAASQAPISPQVVESHGSPASEQPASAAPQVPQASIVFEDASDKAGIDFTHSFARGNWVRCSKAPALVAPGSTTTTPAFPRSMSRTAAPSMIRCIRTRSNRSRPHCRTIISITTMAMATSPT